MKRRHKYALYALISPLKGIDESIADVQCICEEETSDFDLISDVRNDLLGLISKLEMITSDADVGKF